MRRLCAWFVDLVDGPPPPEPSVGRERGARSDDTRREAAAVTTGGEGRGSPRGELEVLIRTVGLLIRSRRFFGLCWDWACFASLFFPGLCLKSPRFLGLFLGLFLGFFVSLFFRRV